jgi:hypothetical protein
MEERAVVYGETMVQVIVVVSHKETWCCRELAELYTEQA